MDEAKRRQGTLILTGSSSSICIAITHSRSSAPPFVKC